ncbi:histidine kinase [Natrinema saccharevitans]|uniref:Histidine kinase n=1 Tax=Natrinema saccharevitans TaxID=301967 RepID=A0A1S8ARA8_9EURY|nr:histidine kinase [Natrinema saccharevitans]
MGNEMRVAEPRVLMVDDEKKVADAYALRLEDVADVTVVYGGEEALAAVDDHPVPDVVLLDRHMPGLSGDEVLDRLRDRDLRTRVVMVTAIDPGLDIVDMPFDDYLSKPVEREDLRAVIDQQCQVLAYELLGEYFRLESTRAVIDAELTADEIESDERLDEIEARRAAIEERVLGLLPDAEALLAEFSGIDRGRY